MNNNKIESIEWHKSQLGKLLEDKDDFYKVETEIDTVLEKFRTKGSKDKSKRKRSIKDIVSSAFGSKKEKKEKSTGGVNTSYTPADDVTKPPKDIDQ